MAWGAVVSVTRGRARGVHGDGSVRVCVCVCVCVSVCACVCACVCVSVWTGSSTIFSLSLFHCATMKRLFSNSAHHSRLRIGRKRGKRRERERKREREERKFERMFTVCLQLHLRSPSLLSLSFCRPLSLTLKSLASKMGSAGVFMVGGRPHCRQSAEERRTALCVRL